MKIIIILMVLLMFTGCAEESISYEEPDLTEIQENINIGDDSEDIGKAENNEIEENHVEDYDTLKELIIQKFDAISPEKWGENIDGVITEIDYDEKIVALTFDACDGTPDSYDEDLINFLIQEKLPATLFINAQWIKENQEVFMELSENPLFEIANHGYDHKPLSVTGQRAYNIQGTESVEQVFDEIYKNQLLIKELTGDYPKYFRSGTAYYDDASLEIIEELGLKAVNYNILGDAGGTFNKDQIIQAFESAEEGSIFLFHMNRPHSDVSSGIKEGVRILKDKGYQFTQIGQYDLFLK